MQLFFHNSPSARSADVSKYLTNQQNNFPPLISVLHAHILEQADYPVENPLGLTDASWMQNLTCNSLLVPKPKNQCKQAEKVAPIFVTQDLKY